MTAQTTKDAAPRRRWELYGDFWLRIQDGDVRAAEASARRYLSPIILPLRRTHDVRTKMRPEPAAPELLSVEVFWRPRRPGTNGRRPR